MKEREKSGNQTLVQAWQPRSTTHTQSGSVGRQLQRSGEVRERQWTVFKVYIMRLKEGN